MPSGSPQSVPVWVGREDDHILICTGEGSLKAKNTRRDLRVALSIVDFHDPYKEAQLRGRVVERRPDGDYTGKPFPFRNPERRVALVIEIDKKRYTKVPFEHGDRGVEGGVPCQPSPLPEAKHGKQSAFRRDRR
jgi:hypothetical protein